MSKFRLHLTGGDGFGWALDEDIETFRQALPHNVELVGLKEADLVYSPWWRGLASIGSAALVGKRVICGFDNPIFFWITQPDFRGIQDFAGLWLAHGTQALQQARSIGLNCGLVPYALRTDIFKPLTATNGDRSAVRRKLGLPPNAYIIGNFQRDSEGSNLAAPKQQKGPDLFAAIVRELHDAGHPIHVMLAGPRRHWLRDRLFSYGVPFTYVGKDISGDDLNANLRTRAELNELYHALDLYLLTSRWEGGPYALLEAAGTRTKVLSPAVGIAQDLLEQQSIFTSIPDAITRIADDVAKNTLGSTIDPQYRRLVDNHSIEGIKAAVAQALEQAASAPVFQGLPSKAERLVPQQPGNSLKERFRRKLLRIMPRRPSGNGIAISIFREYVKPPYGGGNQFMLALRDALVARGVRVLNNQVGESIDGYIFDSLWFDQKLLSKLARLRRPRVAHRIDGPIHLYRGQDKELDDRIFEINEAFATTTVVQSIFTLQKLNEVGYHPVNPVVVHNASDPRIFNRVDKSGFESSQKVRLISTSWSNNQRKGGDVYAWLDKNLDWSRFDYSFVGRSSAKLENIHTFDAVPSKLLADKLRTNDIYITASQNDPCSNALIEALSCGLPAIYLKSGGHPELVGNGGLGFDEAEQIPELLDQMTRYYRAFQSSINVQSIDEVAESYLVCATTG